VIDGTQGRLSIGFCPLDTDQYELAGLQNRLVREVSQPSPGRLARSSGGQDAWAGTGPYRDGDPFLLGSSTRLADGGVHRRQARAALGQENLAHHVGELLEQVIVHMASVNRP
jgi:hypothetical protein